MNDHSCDNQDKPDEERNCDGLTQEQNAQRHRDDWLQRVEGCAIGGAVLSQRQIPKEMAERCADQADVEDRQDRSGGSKRKSTHRSAFDAEEDNRQYRLCGAAAQRVSAQKDARISGESRQFRGGFPGL